MVVYGLLFTLTSKVRKKFKLHLVSAFGALGAATAPVALAAAAAAAAAAYRILVQYVLDGGRIDYYDLKSSKQTETVEYFYTERIASAEPKSAQQLRRAQAGAEHGRPLCSPW